MLIVAGEIRMQPGSRQQFLDAVHTVVVATLAESGCRTYAFTPDPDDPELIRLFELWDDEPSLLAHFESPHIAAWRQTSAELPIVTSELFRYDVTDVAPLG